MYFTLLVNLLRVELPYMAAMPWEEFVSYLSKDCPMDIGSVMKRQSLYSRRFSSSFPKRSEVEGALKISSPRDV
ncbi:hypothetical protein KC19_VG204000 [Ceratodon purpureus]|uniref:Uncharacterized protein n=1 Tax=Ceratodon purpureus TaxID=3225 RepID=A0A8T0HSK5_CERPU|nr:hypothetical protein KC19_VG204000 [Ceratodon purpureus]